MSSGRQVVRNARAEEGESDATLQGTEGLDELEAPNPVPTHEAGPSLEHSQSISEPGVGRLDELAVPSPLKDGPGSSRHSQDLEGAIRRASHQQHEARESSSAKPSSAAAKINLPKIYIHSYLVFFSILGTLARLGLQAITIYPGAPVALGEIWANVAGTLVMGFLAEDRTLFQRDLAAATQRFQKRHDDSSNSNGGGSSANGTSSPSNTGDNQAASAQLKKDHMAIKKTIPLYIGLSVGFCGSFTTFSSFMRDAFLALSNDLNTAPTSTKTTTATPRPRNAGYSLAAVLAVLILVVAASLAALSFGAHLALLSEHVVLASPRAQRNTSRSSRSIRSVLDPLIAVLAWPLWLGAIFMAIWPPHETWRGQAVFALVFAPAGCLLRFYLSLWLNARVPCFPLGTFAANLAGTVVLGMCYDLQHSSSGGGGVIGCQVLQGVMDGFCGCLTTVSTWVLELKTLRRGHAYVYGAVSLAVGLGGLVVVMGSVKWTVGFEAIRCKT